MQQNVNYPARPRRGLAVGLAVSLLLHALLLVLWHLPSTPPAAPQEPRRWTEVLTVRLVPPPPPPTPPETAPAPSRLPQPGKRVSVLKPPIAPVRRPEAITVVPPPAAPATVEPAEPAAPRFDPEAARAAARGIANDLAPPPANWAAAELNKGKEWKETRNEKLGRAIGSAARPDCKTAYAGAGLLAPLFMLADKKDSGCKM